MLTAAISCVVLALSIINNDSSTQPMEDSFKEVIEISQTMPLTRLSQKMGGHGKIAVLVNISDFNGTTSPTSVERVDAWQRRWPEHQFVVVASHYDSWPIKIKEIAGQPELAAIIIIESLPPEVLASWFQDNPFAKSQLVLCLNTSSTEHLLPCIAKGTIFAGLRSRSKTFEYDPKVSTQQLFDQNFALVDQQTAEAELNKDHKALVPLQTEGK